MCSARLPSTSVPSAILRLWQMSAYIDVQVTHDCWNTWLLATGPLSREIILEMP